MTAIVSVIMPAYRTEKYIADSIQSVLNQTFSDWELLVVDDGSPDNLTPIVEKFSGLDNRIKLIHQKNSGVSAARNTGIKYAEGEYICFLDSDDIWAETFLEKMISKSREKGTSFVYSGYVEEDDSVKSRCLGEPYSKGNILKLYSSGKQKMWICGILVKLKLIKDNSLFFSDGGRFSEDIEFILKILTLSQAEVVEEELAYYQWRRDSVTNSETWSKNHEDMITALSRAKLFIEEHYRSNDKEEILAQIGSNQATQMSRLLWGAVKNNEQDFVNYLLKTYPDIISSKARKPGHTAKLIVCRNSFFRSLIQKIS